LLVTAQVRLARAEAPKGAQDLEIESPVVEVTSVDAEGHEHKHKFNLKDPKEYRELQEMLKEAKVVKIEKMAPSAIFGLSTDLALWTLVVFGLLYWILRKAAWGPMLEGLQRREESIHGALTEAQKAREEAKALRDQLQKELDTNAAKVAAMLDEARRDGQRLKDELLTEGRTEVGKERDRLLREMAMARDQAIQDLVNQTAQLATLVSAKAIRRQLTPDDHRRLVDDALAELSDAATDLRQEVWSTKA
jgi:F-type H+-transporting ATPase subunit b